MDEPEYPNTTGYADVHWPKVSPARALVSIRPEIEMLNAGKFDAELYALMRGAPTTGRASLLTMWHECATFSLHDKK